MIYSASICLKMAAISSCCAIFFARAILSAPNLRTVHTHWLYISQSMNHSKTICPVHKNSLGMLWINKKSQNSIGNKDTFMRNLTYHCHVCVCEYFHSRPNYIFRAHCSWCRIPPCPHSVVNVTLVCEIPWKCFE